MKVQTDFFRNSPNLHKIANMVVIAFVTISIIMAVGIMHKVKYTPNDPPLEPYARLERDSYNNVRWEWK